MLQFQNPLHSTMERSSEVYVTRTARIYLGADGIVRAIISPGAELTRQDAVEGLGIVRQLCGDCKRPYLVDARAIRSADSGNREYAGRPEHAQYVSACALIVDSPFTRLLMNLFLSVNQPPSPTRLVSSEDEGIEWLRQYL
jgi:hypothetical protein